MRIAFRTSPNAIRPLESLILSRAAFHSRLAPLAAIVILISSAACTVPLAPGYAISKESREIQFVSGASPELKIRGQFTLVNSGTSKLNFIDVVVPVEKTFGMNDLHVEVNGHEVSAVPLPKELQYDHPHTLRIPLESTWEQKQKRELLIEYVLALAGRFGLSNYLEPKNLQPRFQRLVRGPAAARSRAVAISKAAGQNAHHDSDALQFSAALARREGWREKARRRNGNSIHGAHERSLAVRGRRTIC